MTNLGFFSTTFFKMASFYWFYLRRNDFIFWSPGGGEHVHVSFIRTIKSTFLDFPGNGGSMLTTFLICSYRISCCFIQVEPTIHDKFSQNSGKKYASNRETPLLRARCANTVQNLQTWKPTLIFIQFSQQSICHKSVKNNRINKDCKPQDFRYSFSRCFALPA